ncbi:MAG: hypothetical protein J2P47_01520 [Acetobacteraceae bacterium]|nr:hypothetical protein [Acetobacteraceae bacterium]
MPPAIHGIQHDLLRGHSAQQHEPRDELLHDLPANLPVSRYRYGCAALGAAKAASGHSEPSLGDFSIAFMVVSVIGLLASLISVRLDAGAGAELS